jgi:hypothetical protein
MEKFTPEQETGLENDRTVSDAELIKGGAGWKRDEQTGERTNLEITEDQAKELNMEHEGGIVDNLGTYIRMNKRVLLPFDSVQVEKRERTKKFLEDSKGCVWKSSDNKYQFIDKDNNLVAFDVDPDKIKSLSEQARTTKGVTASLESAIQKELNSLGFRDSTINYDNLRWAGIPDAVDSRLREVEDEQRKADSKEFSF